MSEHEHNFGLDPRDAPIGTARMCIDRRCTQWGVRHRGRVRWEDPTSAELLSITCKMMEDLVIVDAMQIIHGKERGLAHARRVLGYGE